MYTAIINGVHENGKFLLNEMPPATKKYKIAVMFVEEENEVTPLPKGVKLGSWKDRKLTIPDDFNEPLEDLNS
jgi:hypothetical protein